MVLLRCKVVLAGDATVGKTALVEYFHQNHYPKNYVMTIGVDFKVKEVVLPESNNTRVELYMFDSAGQNIFKDSVSRYWDGASFVVLVYDATNAESFKSLGNWLKMARDARKMEQELNGIVIANKIDLEDRAVVPAQHGMDFAKANNLDFFESSALRGSGVDPAFNHMAQRFATMYEQRIDKFQKIFRGHGTVPPSRD